MSKQFKIGDVVRLNSGGPLMTVTGVDNRGEGAVTAVWTQESGYGKITLPTVCFELVA